MTHFDSPRAFVLAHLDDDPLELRKFVRVLTKQIDSYNTKNNTKIIFTIFSFQSSLELLQFITTNSEIDFVILDIELSKNDSANGLSLIQKVKKLHPRCAILMSSFHNSTSYILKSLALSADDFLSKQKIRSDLFEHLLFIYENLQKKFFLDINTQSISNSTSCERTPENLYYPYCAGKTLKTISLRVPKILKSPIKSILIEGESGTGKEVVADIFEYYLNKNFKFIRVNCGSFSDSLLESELFGYKKGAFTGAINEKIGLIEAANNGILFLDEINSLSYAAQASLIRAIENQEIFRIGETVPKKINVLFICATNVSLDTLIKEQKFRNDLAQRLKEIEIYLPPLRERKDEISELIDFFCENLSQISYKIDPLAKKILCEFDWSAGNIRELRNTLKAMTEFASNFELGLWGIPSKIFESLNLTQEDLPVHKNKIENKNQMISVNLEIEGRPKTYQELCDELLIQIIEHHTNNKNKFNMSEISKKLNISRTTLLNKMKSFAAKKSII